MQSLLNVLYGHMLNNWHTAEGILDREEHMDYKRCCLFRERQEKELKQRLGEESALLEKWIENAEQIQNVDCRLCFIRGLSMGLALQSLAAGER